MTTFGWWTTALIVWTICLVLFLIVWKGIMDMNKRQDILIDKMITEGLMKQVEDGDIIYRCPNCDDDMMFLAEDGNLQCANKDCRYTEAASDRLASEKQRVNNGGV